MFFFKLLFQLKKISNYLRCYILSVTWATWQFTSSIPLGLFSSSLSSMLYIVLIWNCALGISYCYMLMFILCLLYVSHCRLGEGWALTNRFNPAINDIGLITLFVGAIQSSLLGVAFHMLKTSRWPLDVFLLLLLWYTYVFMAFFHIRSISIVLPVLHVMVLWQFLEVYFVYYPFWENFAFR